MKQTFLFYILACMTSLFIFSSCEENTDQVIKKQPDTTKEITNRDIQDCEDCPQTPEHCCCEIENLSDNDLQLIFCGVYTMTIGSTCGPVSPPSPCSTISGVSLIMNLLGNERKYFCVPTGGSFSISKLLGIDSDVRITCKADQVNPPWIDFTIDNNPWYFYAGGCDLDKCS